MCVITLNYLNYKPLVINNLEEKRKLGQYNPFMHA